MRMKTIHLVLCWIGVALAASAQPKVALRMAYNAEQNQYEVFAKPNFSAQNFTWGPSQVSIALPAEQTKYSLSVRSQQAGTWADNSIATPTGTAMATVFHGITTAGAKLDMVSGEENLLFTFSLPTGYVEQVRLFDNAKDPDSSQPGMQGGDFRSYMSDAVGKDHLVSNTQPVSLSALQDNSAIQEQGQLQLIAYPNPAPAGTFRLLLKGFSPDEVVTVRLASLTGAEQKRITDKVINLMGRTISLPASGTPYMVLSLDRATSHESLTQRIWMQQ